MEFNTGVLATEDILTHEASGKPAFCKQARSRRIAL